MIIKKGDRRRSGKTTQLVLLSSKNNIPIIVATWDRIKVIEKIANERKLTIPEPILATNFINNHPTQINPSEIQNGILIDDLEHVLTMIFKTKINYATTGCIIEDIVPPKSYVPFTDF